MRATPGIRSPAPQPVTAGGPEGGSGGAPEPTSAGRTYLWGIRILWEIRMVDVAVAMSVLIFAMAEGLPQWIPAVVFGIIVASRRHRSRET